MTIDMLRTGMPTITNKTTTVQQQRFHIICKLSCFWGIYWSQVNNRAPQIDSLHSNRIIKPGAMSRIRIESQFNCTVLNVLCQSWFIFDVFSSCSRPTIYDVALFSIYVTRNSVKLQLEYCLPHMTQSRSFHRQSSQPITWLILTNKQYRKMHKLQIRWMDG